MGKTSQVLNAAGEALKKIFLNAWKLVNDYPVVASGIAIYLYYLLASIDFFTHAREGRSVLDYFLQFDSLLWMWIATVALLQVQKYRKRQREEERQRQIYQNELERQRIQNELLEDITVVLQDKINNPLTIISQKTREVKKKFDKDPEIVRWIESIDGAAKRIEHAVRELREYEIQKLIKGAQERISKLHPTRS